MNFILIAIGGGIGAAARYALSTVISEHRTQIGKDYSSRYLPIPWGTIIVNLVGSFIIGSLLLRGGSGSGPVPLLLVASFCGGFTTFSAATVEAVRLARRGEWVAAVFSIFTFLGALAAIVAGFLVLSTLFVLQ